VLPQAAAAQNHSGQTPQPSGPLAANATSFTDTTAPAGANCYVLLPLGTTPARSDLVCIRVEFGSFVGAPRNFTLRLNQSSIASLTWTAPKDTTVSGYQVVALGKAQVILDPNTTSLNVPITALTCFVVSTVDNGGVSGFTDAECGLPGFSNLGP